MSQTTARTKNTKNKKRAKRKISLASQADRYQLYQTSVQTPDYEVDFFNRVYKAAYGQKPLILREDFCGTHAVCCDWVRRGKDRIAVGVDLDPEPLQWGIEHNQSKLPDSQRQRIELIKDDVRKVQGPKADVLAAENFSYWYFKTRDELRNYFKIARRNLKAKGVMVLDIMGGPESMEENEEDVRRLKGFKYVWEQHRLDPVTHDFTCYIHFRFPDGSELKRAFTYQWRFWTIPELTELLTEAGFKRVDVYWEGTDPDTGDGNEKYGKVTSAPQDSAWVAYLVAVK